MRSKLAPELLKRYQVVSSWRGLFDLASYWLAILAVFSVAHICNAWYVYLAAAVVISGLQHGLLNLQHEAWHYLCFKSRSLNDLIGAWIYSYPVGNPYYYNQIKHRAHHAYFGTEHDPDIETYTNAGRQTGRQCVVYFSGLLIGGHLVNKVMAVAGGRKPDFPGLKSRAGKMPSLLQEYAGCAIVQALLLAAFYLSGRAWEYLVLWFVPLVTLTSALFVWRNFLEHAHPSSNPTPEERLRDFRATSLERFFVSPIGFNSHAFHHAFPKIPHFHLAAARQAARQARVEYPGKECGTYWSLWLDHLSQLDRPDNQNQIQDQSNNQKQQESTV
ncbi:MAG TPA: fatty acid desaturase [Chroococcales cyanobacterium]